MSRAWRFPPGRWCRASGMAWCCAGWRKKRLPASRRARSPRPMLTLRDEFVCRAMTSGHQPVLLREVLEFLAPRPGGRYLDCTFGGGGHTRALLTAAPEITVIALDRDPAAAERAQALQTEFGPRFELVDRDFGRLAELPAADFDGIL